ncbi:iron permease FTR1 [Pseudogulbenkiania sp. NH8B]|uniref:High-affinity iron transporter n=1 Tax=Pseudogulbenkiania subflava DSM 22618 TaxID=1123014 RepID=A0A1Y6BEW7_9NEIS|nr:MULTISPECIES: FTR1 family protein [Pseudogulbenkiania]BAK77738.1 iron permease FTR1 [Pseudogulbenkiania sp. NH8B]SMF07459.1 high-affinity iron transporter [Pseudogulbenkiania subflava DSM 22618]
MFNALFIIWRESVEALLVVGILHTWLKTSGYVAQGGRYLWGGVAAGLGLAGALAGVMLVLESSLPEGALEYFQVAMVLVAAVLIVQMVFWMRKHGRKLKSELEGEMAKTASSANWWGMFVVVMLAVARESAETVVFLYGLGSDIANTGLASFLGVTAAGFGLAYLTFWLLQQGGKYLSWRLFFRVTEIMLLMLAGALLVTGIDKMIGMGWLQAWSGSVWDTSALLDDSTRFGGTVAALTGYRAQPAVAMLVAYAGYWLVVLAGLKRLKR